MMAKNADRLTPELVDALQGEKIVSLVTTDHESGESQLTAVSWVLANKEGTKIKIAVGHKAHSVTNIEHDPKVTLGVIGAGSYYSVKGTASSSDVIEKTMKYRVVTVDVNSVEDVIFYGGKITVEPAYEKTYNADLAKKLDEEVYELLKD
jgi:hypothetical protein